MYGEIANTDYEGDISDMGDKVHIRTTPTITIRDYQKGQKLITETPDTDKIELLIDKGKYFNFTVDDIDAYQNDISLMDTFSTAASEQMKVEIDSGIMGAFYVDAHAQNKGTAAGRKSAAFNLGTTGSAITLTKANILDILVDAGTVADEQNWPSESRWVVLPAWACGMLKKSDLKDASLTGDGKSVLRNGRIGIIDRFTIYMSNQVASVSDTGTAWHIPFGHKTALTFAAQMTKMESLRGESTFGNIVRGLNVFGWKVVKTESLGEIYAYKG